MSMIVKAAEYFFVLDLPLITVFAGTACILLVLNEKLSFSESENGNKNFGLID